MGWGGGAYRGGAGRENVITRSSLLKVRHRLAGTEFMGEEGVTLGWGWAGARRPPQSLPQGDARSPRPQGQEATNKYIIDPLYSPCSPRPPPGEVGLETQRTETKIKWGDTLGRPAEQMQHADSLRLLSHPLPPGKSQPGSSPWPGGHGPHLPRPQSHSDVPVRPSLQNKHLPPQLSPFPNLHTHLLVRQQRPGPSPTTKMDRWMHG